LPGLRYKSNVLATLPGIRLSSLEFQPGDAVQQANNFFSRNYRSRPCCTTVAAGPGREENGPEFAEIINLRSLILVSIWVTKLVFLVALNGHDGEPLVVAQVPA